MKGILFKPDMIKAINENRKSCTRRLSGLKEINKDMDAWRNPIELTCEPGLWTFRNFVNGVVAAARPRYHPGEIVYVKEAHYKYGSWGKDAKGWWFKADRDYSVLFSDNPPPDICKGHHDRGWYLRSPLFLEALDARTFLEIVSVRPERLKEITIDDAKNEGIRDHVQWIGKECYSDAIIQYANLWDSINPDYPWSINSWVWRYEFKRAERPEGI